MVIFDALQRVGVDAAAHAGHSLGEYSALTASGALDFEDAVKLVTERGAAMQVCAESHEGTMAAILGLDDELVESACHRVDDDVWVANYNAPGQVVIAGSHSGIEFCFGDSEGIRRQARHEATSFRCIPHSLHGACSRSTPQRNR